MRLWLNRSGEVSLREQLMTQVVLGILTRELGAGQRLPSTRELARRYGIHANTVSAAYRQLEQDRWIEFRHGSGVYVSETRPTHPLTDALMVDQLIGDLVASARNAGIAPPLIRTRLRRWLAIAPASHWLLIEPDPELRDIVAHELRRALHWPVKGCTLEEMNSAEVLGGAVALVLPSKAAAVRRALPPGVETVVLQVHPVGPSLNQYLPAPQGVLVGIASRWSEFQRIARTMLVAAGFPPVSLLVRDATQPGWKRGLEATAGVVCDLATAATLPKTCHPIAFQLIAEASIVELQQMESALDADGSQPNLDSPL